MIIPFFFLRFSYQLIQIKTKTIPIFLTSRTNKKFLPNNVIIGQEFFVSSLYSIPLLSTLHTPHVRWQKHDTKRHNYYSIYAPGVTRGCIQNYIFAPSCFIAENCPFSNNSRATYCLKSICAYPLQHVSTLFHNTDTHQLFQSSFSIR